MAKQLFEYTPWLEYESEITNEETGKRQYTSKCGLKSASTTTVLSNYEEKDFLGVWQEKMRSQGEDPDKISEESAQAGTLAHELVEHYLIDGVYPVGNALARTAIDNFYSHVNADFAAAEQPLFYNGLLHKKPENIQIAGRYDQLLKIDSGVFKIKKTGEILEEQFMICDLKTKRSYEKLKKGGIKLKSLPRMDKCDFLFKNCLQASMYSATLTLQSNFRYLYGAGVTGAVLVYTNEEVCKLAYLSRTDLNYYWRVFKEILRDFYDIEPLTKSWGKMIEEANWRYCDEVGYHINNVPKEIVLCS